MALDIYKVFKCNVSTFDFPCKRKSMKNLSQKTQRKKSILIFHYAVLKGNFLLCGGLESNDRSHLDREC